MTEHARVVEFPGSIRVSDARSLIVKMNKRAAEAGKDDDGLSPEISAQTPHVDRQW